MRIIGKNLIETFQRKHAESRKALNDFIKRLEASGAKSLQELRKEFNKPDCVDGKTVFNVGGNKCRVIALIQYGIQLALITHVLTHNDYDKDSWK